MSLYQHILSACLLSAALCTPVIVLAAWAVTRLPLL
jgi:hypothetical protein